MTCDKGTNSTIQIVQQGVKCKYRDALLIPSSSLESNVSIRALSRTDHYNASLLPSKSL